MAKRINTVLEVVAGLPQSYVITRSTALMRELLREHFQNNPGKLFTMDEIARITGKKWNNAFVYYASRSSLDANAPCDFPIVAVKGAGDKAREVVGYRYQPLANSEMEQNKKYRNAKGHVIKPSNLVGKWEAKATQKEINAKRAAERAAAEAAKLAAKQRAAAAETTVESETTEHAPVDMNPPTTADTSVPMEIAA